MTDCISSRMGASDPSRGPDHQPLGMLIRDCIEDIDGNIWAECCEYSAKTCYVSAIFKCVMCFLLQGPMALDAGTESRTEGIWIGPH